MSSAESSNTSSDSQATTSFQIELFMVLKDVHATYYLSSNGDVKCTPSVRSQQIIVYWRPPGAMQWHTKYKSEVVSGKSNLQFVAGLILDVELKDAPATQLKFEIRQKTLMPSSTIPKLWSGDADQDGMQTWSSVQITADKLLLGGSKGVELFLPLNFGIPETQHLAKQCRKVNPGSLFLRGEVMQPPPFGVYLQFGLQSEKSQDYFLEFHKLNQENAFEFSHPYTLVYRSEIEDRLPPFPTHGGIKVFFLESALSNGDLDRVLKVDVYKKGTFERKGFALTTLATLLRDKDQSLTVDRVDSHYPYKKKEIKVILSLHTKATLLPLNSYFKRGWKIVPIFAVDFSRSNWNTELHRQVLHESSNGPSPYEEALEWTSLALSKLVIGHSIFYGFGLSTNAYMSACKPNCEHVGAALQNYREALCMSLMSSMKVSGNSSEEAASSSMASPFVFTGGSLLAPLLLDVLTMLGSRKEVLDFHALIIFSDGEISDPQKCMTVLQKLASFPVSLIFVGIGFGYFRSLLHIQDAFNTPFYDVLLSRKFVHVIHYRSRSHWESSLSLDKYRSDPQEVFFREITNTVHEHALHYFWKKFHGLW